MQKFVKVWGWGGSLTLEETGVHVPTVEAGLCQACGSSVVWPDTGGQKSGAVAEMEEQRSSHVWTWDRGDPPAVHLGRDV